MKILHIVPGLNDPTNGIAVAAKMIAHGQRAEIVDARQFGLGNRPVRMAERYSEIWVHGMWTPVKWLACLNVIRSGRSLVRMTHGSLSPVYLKCQGKWRKRLAGIVERWLFKRTERVVVTCGAEREWVRRWGLENEVEIVDLKQYFNLDNGNVRAIGCPRKQDRDFHLLYLGHRHVLKGLQYLERAVDALRRIEESEKGKSGVELRIVSNAVGEEKEKVWAWCDVLVLPTLSENFGLVVAEALERGKGVVTTDGAPAWENQSGVTYLKGYREGTDAQRVELLKNAIERFLEGRNA